MATNEIPIKKMISVNSKSDTSDDDISEMSITSRTPIQLDNADKYSLPCLKDNLELIINTNKQIKHIKLKYGVKQRQLGLFEGVSQNIIKFILLSRGVPCTSNCKTGDLQSTIEGKIECKSFISMGPISFGPKEGWDVIYFLDARKYLDNKYILYKTDLKNNSTAWLNIKVSSKETFEMQIMKGRRPRINFKSLYDQIKDYTTIIFKGDINYLWQSIQ